MKPSYADIVVGRSRQLRGATSLFRGYIWGYAKNKNQIKPYLASLSECYSLPAPAPFQVFLTSINFHKPAFQRVFLWI
jgi:hypothetical protein